MSEVVAGEIFSRSVNTAGILCSQGNSLYCNTIAINNFFCKSCNFPCVLDTVHSPWLWWWYF